MARKRPVRESDFRFMVTVRNEFTGDKWSTVVGARGAYEAELFVADNLDVIGDRVHSVRRAKKEEA